MNVHRKFAPLTMDAEHPLLQRAIERFLTQVWTCHPETAVTFMATKGRNGWKEHPIDRNRRKGLRRVLGEYPASEYDIYFCPNAFSSSGRTKVNALPTPYAWCDIDDANPAGFKPRPNILLETSTRSFQGLWIWDQMLDPREAENISKGLLQYGGDHGFAVNKYLRVPGTFNHKPTRKGERVLLRRFDGRLKRIPDRLRQSPIAEPACHLLEGLNPSRYSPGEVKRRYRRKVGLVAGSLMMARKVMRADRSGAVYLIIAALVVKAGANNDEIACVLLDNPYFTSKWGEDVEEAERQIVKIRAELGEEQ